MSRPAPHPYAVTTPEYAQARERLTYLPDLGAASLEVARQHLGPAAPIQDVVQHAAAHPVHPALIGPIGIATERPGTDAAPCGRCGTVLDPDGSCLTCQTTTTEANA